MKSWRAAIYLAVHAEWSIHMYSFGNGHWLMLSGRGHQCAVFWGGPIGMSVCCIKKPAERDAAPDWLTQDPVWVNTPSIRYYTQFPLCTAACQMSSVIPLDQSPRLNAPRRSWASFHIVSWTGFCSWVVWESPTHLPPRPRAASAMPGGRNLLR